MVLAQADLEVGAKIRSGSRVFTIKNRAGPLNDPKYLTVAMAGGLSWPQGTPTPVEIPSPQAYGAFARVANVPGERGNAGVTLTGRYLSDLSDFLAFVREGCPLDVQVHFGECKDPRDFNVFDKIVVLELARPTDYTTTELGTLTSGDNSVVDETMPVEALNMYEIVPITFAERAQTVVENEVIAVEVCDTLSCGDCEDPSSGCEKMFALQLASGGSPGILAELAFSSDGGATWGGTTIDTLAANEEPDDMACVGLNLVVVSEDSCSLHYAPRADILGGTETWTEMATGFNALGCPRAIFAISPRETKIAGAGGFVYGTTDPTASVTVEDAGVATTQDLNDIHAANGNVWVAVGASNAVVYTLNGSDDSPTWQSVVGPAVGIALNTVFAKTESEWWVGTAGGELWFTMDFGQTWTEKLFPGTGAGQVRKVLFVTDTVGYMAHDTAAPAGRILRTVNGGFDWYVTPEDLGVIPANDRINDLAGCGGVEVANAVLAGGLADSAADGIIVIGKHASA